MMVDYAGFPGVLVILIAIILAVVPFWKLLPKFGLSKWLILFLLLPVGWLILLWIMALREPVVQDKGRI